jgi:uncharacterized membrane protein YedE/YeeE
MTNFTPVSAAIGGALIGLSSVLLMLLTGRIAGISGFFAGLFTVPSVVKTWCLAFVAGLVLVPVVLGSFGYVAAPPKLPSSWAVIVAAGLLVGLGTRLGGGCTSGHGICGIGRFSTRSIAATIVFMVTAVITVVVTRHMLGG